MNKVSAENSNYDYYLGEANIDTKVVDDAVTYFKKGLNHIKNNVRDSYCICAKSPLEEDRFRISMCYTISKLDRSLPVENLLYLLSQKVEGLGFPVARVYLTFQKGTFEGNVNYWHRDFPGTPSTHVSICYSNVPNWSTRILKNDYQFKDQDLQYVRRKSPLNDIAEKSPLHEQFDKMSESSEIGVFYNVDVAWHRSPHKTDFAYDAEKENYRLFMRFER